MLPGFFLALGVPRGGLPARLNVVTIFAANRASRESDNGG